MGTILDGFGPEYDKARTLRRMDCFQNDIMIEVVSEWWKQFEDGVPTINSTITSTKVSVPTQPQNHATCRYNLVGLIGWWRRIEKEGKEGEKIWMSDFKKEQKVLSARRKKEEFLQRYWPNLSFVIYLKRILYLV